jgi:hypothetical protein
VGRRRLRQQRTQLLGGLFERIEAHADPTTAGRVKVVAVPREGWRRFFEYAVLEFQTGACSNFSDMRTRLEKLAAAIRAQ